MTPQQHNVGSLQSSFQTFELKHFDQKTLVVNSECLRGNPLGDPTTRFNPVLIPKSPPPADGWPVVLILSGFTGNGTNAFNVKTFETNTPQTLDLCVDRGEAPSALYVFCDAMTAWGGSQFLNSAGTGRYEDYIVNELCELIRTTLPSSRNHEKWCVAGGSSGGYGALHLVTCAAAGKTPRFSHAIAIAPDSFLRPVSFRIFGRLFRLSPR